MFNLLEENSVLSYLLEEDSLELGEGSVLGALLSPVCILSECKSKCSEEKLSVKNSEKGGLSMASFSLPFYNPCQVLGKFFREARRPSYLTQYERDGGTRPHQTGWKGFILRFLRSTSISRATSHSIQESSSSSKEIFEKLQKEIRTGQYFLQAAF